MWAIGLKLELPNAQNVRVATLGGKRKLANVEELKDSSPFGLPKAFEKGLPERCKGLRLVAVTPHHAKRTDHPCLPDFLTENDKGEFVGTLEGVGEVVLRAAYVGRPMHVSGWDMVTNGGQAKPTRRLAPAGSVWFFQKKKDGADFTREELVALWMKQLTPDEDGLNCVVPGVWNPSV
jgi:CRISPR-associated protein Cmr3